MLSFQPIHKHTVLGFVQNHLWNESGIYRCAVEPGTSLKRLNITTWEARHILQKTLNDIGCTASIPRDFGERPDEPWNRLQNIDDVVRQVQNAWAREQAGRITREGEMPRREKPKSLIILSGGEIEYVPVGIHTPKSQ